MKYPVEYDVFMGMDMGERLKHLREARGFTQGELAQKIGRNQQHISYLEQKGTVLAQDLPMLANALGVPILAFFEEAEREWDKATPPIDWELQLAGMPLPADVRESFVALFRLLADKINSATTEEKRLSSS